MHELLFFLLVQRKLLGHVLSVPLTHRAPLARAVRGGFHVGVLWVLGRGYGIDVCRWWKLEIGSAVEGDFGLVEERDKWIVP